MNQYKNTFEVEKASGVDIEARTVGDMEYELYAVWCKFAQIVPTYIDTWENIKDISLSRRRDGNSDEIEVTFKLLQDTYASKISNNLLTVPNDNKYCFILLFMSKISRK